MVSTAIRKSDHAGCAGFTLLELVLATFISFLVIGIVSVSLSFSLRFWEKRLNQKTSDMPNILDLMKWQLADFDPVRIRSDGELHLVFHGDEHSLALTTDRSVKAISNGVPVVARYAFVAGEKRLYYSEIPLDPYHPEAIEEFLKAKPRDPDRGRARARDRDRDSWPRFYSTEVASFSLSYIAGGEKGGVAETWEEAESVPEAILIKWSPEGGVGPFLQVIYPNFLFPKRLDQKQGTTEPTGAQR